MGGVPAVISERVRGLEIFRFLGYRMAGSNLMEVFGRHTASIEMVLVFLAISAILLRATRDGLPRGGATVMLYVLGPSAALYLTVAAALFFNGH